MSDIICISRLRWEFAAQRHQQILSQLAKQRVLFIEEPISSLSAPKPYLEVFRKDHHGTPNLTVVRLILPVGKKRRIEHDDPQAQRCYARLLSKFLQVENYHNPIVWLDTATGLPVADTIKHKLLIYDIPDFQQQFDNSRMTSAV